MRDILGRIYNWFISFYSKEKSLKFMSWVEAELLPVLSNKFI